MSRIATGGARFERAPILVLGLLSVLLVSGNSLMPVPSGAPAAGLDTVGGSVSALAERDIELVLGSVNPTLDLHTGRRIAAAVIQYSAQYQLDPELVTAVLIVESSARPGAISSKGAVGLMQVMPHMMRPMGLAGNAATIESNIQAGCYILANNIRRLGEERGISSYFWGNSIRGAAYLEKVQVVREEIRRRRPS